MDFADLILEYTTKVCNLSWNYPSPYSNLLTHILKTFQMFLEGKQHLNSHILTINETTVKSLKLKPLCSGHRKHEHEISANDIRTPPPQLYLKMIPRPWIEWFKRDLKEIKGEITILKHGQGGIKKTLANLKGVHENLNGCATELKSIISNLKVEEGTLKVINDEFRANVTRLETTLKTAQVDVS